MMFQVTAVAILAVFYGCYFGKMASQRKRGIQTDQMGRGKTGLVRVIELSTKAAAIAVPAAELVCICRGSAALSTPVRAAGAVLAVLGTATFLCSVYTMADSWRAGVSLTDKTRLVTRGIYRYSRNPAFLGFDLVYLGVALMFWSPLLFGVSAVAMLLFHLQIVNVEEDHLIAAFGEEYLTYRQQVNRYLGRR